MKLSIVLTTLISLSFSLFIGCGKGQKSASAPAPAPTVPPISGNTCDPGYVYNSNTGMCDYRGNGNGIYPYSIWDDGIQITNQKKWEKFLEDYGYSLGGAFCIDNEDDFLWDFGGGAGIYNCGTYDSNGIQLFLADLTVHPDGTGAAINIFVRSSWSTGYRTLSLPVGLHNAHIYRRAINDIPDAGFRFQMTLNGKNGPKIFILEGDTVDVNASNGADVNLKYDGQIFGKARLRF